MKKNFMTDKNSPVYRKKPEKFFYGHVKKIFDSIFFICSVKIYEL